MSTTYLFLSVFAVLILSILLFKWAMDWDDDELGSRDYFENDW